MTYSIRLISIQCLHIHQKRPTLQHWVVFVICFKGRWSPMVITLLTNYFICTHCLCFCSCNTNFNFKIPPSVFLVEKEIKCEWHRVIEMSSYLTGVVWLYILLTNNFLCFQLHWKWRWLTCDHCWLIEISYSSTPCIWILKRNVNNTTTTVYLYTYIYSICNTQEGNLMNWFMGFSVMMLTSW